MNLAKPNGNQNPLNPKQQAIYDGLKSIGPEIAAFYLDGVKMIGSREFATPSYLLAHIAREIEGGLKDVLVFKEIKAKENEKTHREEIALALGLSIDDDFVIHWHKIAAKFHKYAHRRGAWKEPRKIDVVRSLWFEFEDILFKLVGTYYSLLDRIDRIIEYEEPTEEIISTLPNLLSLGTRFSYFFRRLKHIKWLNYLKNSGFFAPSNNPKPYEVDDRPGFYSTPHWAVLDYLEYAAKENQKNPNTEISNSLLEIINSLVHLENNKFKRVDNYITNWFIVKLIFWLPLDMILSAHTKYVDIALRSKWDTTMVAADIGKEIIPRLIVEKNKNILLQLINIILDYKKPGRKTSEEYSSVMDEFWLKEALENNFTGIFQLCGLEAAEIAIKKIKNILSDDSSQFDFIWIPTIEDHSQIDFPTRYDVQLVQFIRDIYQNCSPDKITHKIHELSKEDCPILKRIAIHMINFYYDQLNDIFWDWDGNPLDELHAKHEIYELIKDRCHLFSNGQIDVVIDWIETKDHRIYNAEGKDLDELMANVKKEWLTALLSLKNEKVEKLYKKYNEIYPRIIEHPGFYSWHEMKFGHESPIEKAKLCQKSIEGIVQYLCEFRGGLSWDEPNEEGLSETLRACVSENPSKFADNVTKFIDVKKIYQHSILWALYEAWRAKKEFKWDSLFGFMIDILDSPQFWSEEYPEGSFHYRNWIISVIAELIEEGTRQDTHSFAPRLFPEAERILFTLINKAESNLSKTGSFIDSVLNSTRGKVFNAAISYSLRYARLYRREQKERWVESIKAEFDKRLDRGFEQSLEFSVTLGRYLDNLAFLDEKWVINNINKIFPKGNRNHWEAVFTAYLFYTRTVYHATYKLLKDNKHFKKALRTKFSSPHVGEKLVQTICIGYLYDWELLEDPDSLIFQLLNEKDINFYSEIVRFFWRPKEKPDDKFKLKVRPIWKALLGFLSKNQNKKEYQQVIASLSKWLSLIDEIDEELFEWLVLSAKYMGSNFDVTFFIEYLSFHVEKTPEYVGKLYLEMLNNGVYPDYKKEHIQRIVEQLYAKKQRELADRICNMYGARGFDFLRLIYDQNRNS